MHKIPSWLILAVYLIHKASKDYARLLGFLKVDTASRVFF